MNHGLASSTIRLLSLCFVSAALYLGGSSASADEPRTKTLLLLGQKPDGHPPGTHEYTPGQRILKHLLGDVPGWKIEVVQADNPWPEGPELIAKADAVVLFVSQGGAWATEDPRRYDAFAQLAARGGGLSGLHWGVGVKDPKKIAPFVKLLGASHGGKDRKFKFFEEITYTPSKNHPVTTGVGGLTLREEFYFALKREPTASESLVPLVTIPVDGDDGKPHDDMVSWAWTRPDGGRSFGFTGLHFHDNWQRSEYRRLITQGVLWTMGREIPKDGVNVDLPDDLLRLE
ncbi:MAG: ThuA domain-containing protein [Pirellulales bacterium]